MTVHSLDAARAELRKCREVLNMPPPECAWWAGLSPLERKFLCAAANVPFPLTKKQWTDLAIAERGRVLQEAARAVEHFSDKRRALL